MPIHSVKANRQQTHITTMTSTQKTLTYIEIEPTSQPTSTIIWLHGLGADGSDFVDCLQALNLPSTRFVLPHAPIQPITLNGGQAMRAWYDIYGLTIGTREDATGIRASADRIHQLLQQEIKRGVPSEKIVLAGFSQGGAMALFCGLRYPEKLGGVLALSTYLPLALSLETEAHELNKNTPIFMACGEFDLVVHPSLTKRSYDCLKKLEYPVELHDYPMAHNVCPEELSDVVNWLSKHLS